MTQQSLPTPTVTSMPIATLASTVEPAWEVSFSPMGSVHRTQRVLIQNSAPLCPVHDDDHAVPEPTTGAVLWRYGSSGVAAGSQQSSLARVSRLRLQGPHLPFIRATATHTATVTMSRFPGRANPDQSVPGKADYCCFLVQGRRRPFGRQGKCLCRFQSCYKEEHVVTKTALLRFTLDVGL